MLAKALPLTTDAGVLLPAQLATQTQIAELRRLPETNIPNGAGFSSAFAKRQRVHSRSLYALPRQSRRARKQARRHVC